MTIMIVGDTHFGAKQNAMSHLREQKEVTRDRLIPIINQHKVDRVIQTGDFFDSRRAVSHKAMEAGRRWIDTLLDHVLHVYILVGNHDTYYVDKLTPNSPREFFAEYNEVSVIDRFTDLQIGSHTFSLVPWICRENYQHIMDSITKSTSDYCVGHFELSGFRYMQNIPSEGISSDFLKQYKQVFSGHYHVQSRGANVIYVGTPWQLSFNDLNEEKVVYLLKPDGSIITESTGSQLYQEIYYDEKIKEYDVDFYAGKYIRLIVPDSIQDERRLLKVVQMLGNQAYQITVLRDTWHTTQPELNAQGQIKSVYEHIQDYVGKLEGVDMNVREDIERVINDLYREVKP